MLTTNLRAGTLKEMALPLLVLVMYAHGFLSSQVSTSMVSSDVATLVGFSFPSFPQAVTPSCTVPIFNNKRLLLSDNTPLNKKA